MSLEQLIEPLRRLPADSRTFDCDERFAALHCGLDADTLRELVASGLPSVSAADGRRFEYGDLHFVGLRLRRATAFEWTAQRWAEGLARFAAARITRVEVAYVPQLRNGDGPTTGTVVLPDGERRDALLREGEPAATVQLELHGETPALPPAAAHIVQEVTRRIAFYSLPPALQGDAALARRTGLADCRTAAFVIAEDWRAAGFEARVSQGFFVSVPFSILHSWAELRCGTTWVPADPLLVGVMRDFGGLDADLWPVDRSPAPALSRIEAPFEEVISSARGPVPTSLLTEVIE